MQYAMQQCINENESRAQYKWEYTPLFPLSWEEKVHVTMTKQEYNNFQTYLIIQIEQIAIESVPCWIITFLCAAILPKRKDTTPNTDTIEPICFTVAAIAPYQGNKKN